MHQFDPTKHSTSALEGSIAVFKHTIEAAKFDRKLRSEVPELEEKIKAAQDELDSRTMINK